MSIKRLSLDDCQTLISRYNTDLKALDFQADEIKKVLKELGARHAQLKKVADKKAAAAAKKRAAAAKKKAAAAKKKAAAAAKKRAAAAKKKAAAAAKKAKKAAKKAGRPAAKKAGRPAAKKAGRPAAKKAGRPAAKKAGRPAKKKAGRPAKRKVTAKRSSAKGKRGRKMSYSDWDQLVLNTLKGKGNPVRTSTLLDKGQAWAKKSKIDSSEKYVRGKLGAALIKLVNKTKDVKKVAAEGRGYAYKLS